LPSGFDILLQAKMEYRLSMYQNPARSCDALIKSLLDGVLKVPA